MKCFININRKGPHRAGLRIAKTGIDFEVNLWGDKERIWSFNDFVLEEAEHVLKNGALSPPVQIIKNTVTTEQGDKKYHILFNDLKESGYTHALIFDRMSAYFFDLNNIDNLTEQSFCKHDNNNDSTNCINQHYDDSLFYSEDMKPRSIACAIAACKKVLVDSFKQTEKNVCMMLSYLNFAPKQVIKFGPPGTGKSHSVVKTIKEHCGQEKKRDHKDVITTVFHPDYSYGDFTAKLVPVTVENASGKSVEYQIHAGPLTKALARAFANPYESVYLVIEEINRGNTAAIFGDVFQLLDRDECGKSEYPIHIQTLFYEALEKEFNSLLLSDKGESDKGDDADKNEPTKLDAILKNQQLFLPSNLSIIATMNTSDESVFYMDSAFKRRWHFEYIDVDVDIDKKNEDPINKQITAKINGDANCEWDGFRKALNTFIKDHKNSIRRIEDKLIGLWFIKAQDGEISESEIKNKLMHYLWDNVFARDKQPLINKIKANDEKLDIVTFGDFIKQYDKFIKAFCCTTQKSEGTEKRDSSE